MSAPEGAFEALLARAPHARRAVSAPARTRALWERCFATPPGCTVVKVAGTNGKGSVCAMLSACLSAEGYETGTFTSPHLSDVSERIRVRGEQATRAELRSAAADITPALDSAVAELGDDYEPTYFEALLLIALQLFHRRGVAVAVLEAGIGGSYDAVSAIPGALGVITGVALDHTEHLGGTEAEIARDKAGIADPGTSLVVSSTLSAAARASVERACLARSVKVIDAVPGRVRNTRVTLSSTTAEVAFAGENRPITLALRGRYQVDNLETTLAVLDALAAIVPVTPRALRGLETVEWPGRFEVITGPPRWLLDVAHNPQGVSALNRALDEVLPREARVLLCGMSVDHQTEALAQALRTLAPRVYVADGFYRAAPACSVAALLGAGAEVLGDPAASAASLAERYSASGFTVIVAGSLYLVGVVRAVVTAS